jgi:Carboxypeptidase regulatory-like domain
MKTFIGVLAAIGFIAVSACDTPTIPTNSIVYTLSGQVTDGTSHNPVPNITVGLQTDSNATLTAVSDGQGRYIFPGISSGKHHPVVSVYVQDPNFALYTTVVDLKVNAVTTLDIVLGH